MNKDPQERKPSGEQPTEEHPTGWEGLAEEASQGSLEPSAELEEAMREAAEAVDEQRSARRREPPEPAPAPTRTEESAKAEVEEEVENARGELEATRDRLLRVAADFENFRRRALRDREEAHQFGHQNLVKDLLPTVDNLERAIDHARRGEGGDIGSFLEGMELVLRELQTVLAKHGVTPIEAEGLPFDPAVHEAMAQRTDASVPPNTVVEVLQRGYRLRDRLLRPARVVVSSPPEKQEPGTEGESEG